jgi:uncharacterized Zn finger protein (UPF0148 family)
MIWAPRGGYEHCVSCGTTERRHAGKGFCDICIVTNRYRTDPKHREKVKLRSQEARDKLKATDPMLAQSKRKEHREVFIQRHGYDPLRKSSKLNYTKKRAVAILLELATYIPLTSVEVDGMRTNIKKNDELFEEKVKIFREVAAHLRKSEK